MIYPLLPVYLSRVLGVGAVSLGIIEGIAEGVNSLLKILSGRLSDRWSKRKPIVIAGYSLSSVARPFIAVTTGWIQVLIIRVIDRTGKGIRGAPRDAMLAEFATPETRGKVYGFHRAMDHTGAIIGPLIATAFLLAWPGQYRILFALTIIPGVLAVWTLLKVPEHSAASARNANETNQRNEANERNETNERNKNAPNPPNDPNSSNERISPRLWWILAIILIFSLGNSADAFLLLRLSAALGNDAFLPLLWALLHVVKASLSVYGGTLSDRVGRKSVIVAGWTIYAIVYVGFATTDSATILIAWFLVYGTYFGLAEGTEKALVADLAPTSARGLAFGYYNAALGVGALLASVIFGVLYEWAGHGVAFSVGAGLAAVAAVLLVLVPTDKRGGLLYS